MSCPGCGAENPEGARFCGQCGQSLLTRSDERRVVTVLFADLVGFTTLSERRDPESVKNLVDRVFERLAADITEFGGVVDKIVGDAILALFGAPTAHEDDPERAVRAALQMQRSLAEHATETDAGLAIRIGVNTGEVLVGQLRAGGDSTAMGDVVNTASRLQTRADPGEILVGPDTYLASATSIDYEPRGPVEVKGRDEPVEIHAAIGAHRPPGYRQRRLNTPLVGRAPEYSILTNAVEASVLHRRAQVIVLRGEAGIGKTRLAAEVASWAEAVHDAQVLRGRCLPYGEVNVWWPIAELVRQGCGVSDDDPPEVIGDALERAAADSFGDVDDAERERIVNGLRYLLFLDSPLQNIEKARAVAELSRSVIALTERSTRNQALIVRIADIHWAQPEVLELLGEMADRLCRSPFVLMATARVEEDAWTPRGGRYNAVIINLEPLDREAAAEMLDEMLDGPADPALRADILDRSGGNPFFLEELVNLVSSDGQPGGSADLPGTLRGIIAARLDTLDSGQLVLVEDAATWGQSGPVHALTEMAEAMGQSLDVPAVLASLVDEEILRLDDDRWHFRSDSVRQVAYERLTKAERHGRHAGIAAHLALRHPTPSEASDGVLDLIVGHYAIAADLAEEFGHGDTDTSARALPWLEEAAERASQRESHSVAAQLHEHVLRLLPAGDDHRRVGHLIERAGSLLELWEVDAAVEVVDQAELLARRSEDPTVMATVEALRGDISFRAGNSAEAELYYLRSLESFLEHGDRSGYADAHRRLGMLKLLSQDLPGADHHITEALAAYVGVGNRRGEAWALQNLAWIGFMGGRAHEAAGWARSSAELFGELGDSGGEAWATGLLAFVQFHLGESDEAERLARRVVEDARERNDKWGEGMMLVLLGSIALFTRGEARAAVDYAEQAVRRLSATSDTGASAQASGLLGRARLAQGEVAHAFEVLDPASVAEGLARETILTLRLAAAANLGEPDLATSALAEVMGHELDPANVGERDRLVAVALLLAQSGRAAEATSMLDVAVSTEGADASLYARSAAALCAVAIGDRAGGVRHAEAVLADDRSTYLDRMFAHLALVLERAAERDRVAETILDAALGEVDSVGDRTAQTTTRLIGGLALDALGLDRARPIADEAETRLRWMGSTMDGWRRLASSALAARSAQEG